MAIIAERPLTLLLCADPERLAHFYLVGCGFHLVRQMAHYTELALGSFTLALTDQPFMARLLGLAANPTIRVGGGIAAHPFALSLHCNAVDEDLARLVGLGATVVLPPTDQPWGQRVAYCTDPAGNLLEIAQALR